MSTKKNSLEQLRMLFIMTYLVGAILYFFKLSNLLNKESISNKLCMWIIVTSTILALSLGVLSLASKKICSKSIPNKEVQQQKAAKINYIKAIPYSTNILFATISVASAVLIILKEVNYCQNITDYQIMNNMSLLSFSLLCAASIAALFPLTRLVLTCVSLVPSFDHMSDNWQKTENDILSYCNNQGNNQTAEIT